MMKDGSRRIAIAGGALLIDPTQLDAALLSSAAELFEPRYWEARAQLMPVNRGRGAAWFIGPPPQPWVLRHYRRGGAAARLSSDRYVWMGEARVRSFAEYRLLAAMRSLDLPVPAPLGARYLRRGSTYRCDLITQRIEAAQPMSALLAEGALSEATWGAVGAAVAALHRAGVDHPDLNAHNVLIGPGGTIHVIDFDRGRLRKPGAWSGRNLDRLHRSIAKILAGSASLRAAPRGASCREWTLLLAAYESTAAPDRRAPRSDRPPG